MRALRLEMKRALPPSSSAEFEFEFLRERLRAIQDRLVRPKGLDAGELTQLKAEALAIEKKIKSMRCW